ncbi:HWE histidine kinase domain-containing protein [Dankookia sp. GCM10030260]|uniref:HWE histidine kinase domain-containing protein n=1 Tax=Dankookia sp. GCM10030260 TaxID=3273390 RepID=UPI003622F853
MLILAAVLLPLALLPLGRMVPTLGTEAGALAREAAVAAAEVAASLARQGDASRSAATDPAILVAALAGAPPPGGTRLAILGPDGQLLASAFGEATAGGGPFLTAEHAVAGWPLRVLAIRPAPPPRNGLLPLGAAMAAMLSLAFIMHRRERRARLAAASNERREALRAAALAESEAQLRLALAAAELGCWSWDEAADRVAWDAQAAKILGWCPADPVGLTALRDCIDPADRALLDATTARARRSGDPEQCAVRLRTASGTAPRWIELRTQATAGLGCPTWHGVIADITERRQAEEQQRLLLREVDHRAKNTLAVVQALLRLTRTEDPVSFLPRVEARIAALARAHTLLAQARWQGVGLRRLVEAELGRHAAANTVLSLAGPGVMLAAVATQPVAMVLHELASNAVRFGALTQPGGTLSVSWSVAPAGWLELVWEERLSLPATEVPPLRGIGGRILEATVQDQLGGRIAREWTPEGMRCAIRLPPSSLRPAPAEAVV